MSTEKKLRCLQQMEAVRLERELVRQAYEAGDQQTAHDLLFQVLNRLSSYFGSPECDTLFVSTTVELSTLCFILGRSFSEIFIFLQTALAAAERLGDQRSQAMIRLHLGRLYYFREQRHDAMKAFAEGKRIVEKLGDQDILIQAGEFLGLYFHMQGLFRKAKEYFELAVSSYENMNENRMVNPSAAMWLCYCEAYLGQFHESIGRLDYYRRIATDKSDNNLATTLRSVLGLVLLMIKKHKEASFHLYTALREATSSQNALAHYFAKGGLGILNLYQGRPEKGRDLYAQGLVVASESGIIRQYASPLDLEILYELDCLGLEPIPNFSFKREMVRIMNEPNIHLKGVALRLRAMKKSETMKTDINRMQDLETSQDYLVRCGDPVQLGKTRLEMARLKMREHDHEKARFYAQQAWDNFSIYREEFFPDDLRHLLVSRDQVSAGLVSNTDLLTQFMEIIEELFSISDLNRLFSKVVAATNKFFGAERGGLFWFSNKKTGQNPILRAACNLRDRDVGDDDFRANLTLIFQAYRQNEPQLIRLDSTEPHQVKAMLCLPFEVEGRTRGVLYHDNVHLKDHFKFFDSMQLGKMTDCLNHFIEHVWAFRKRLEERKHTISKDSINKEESKGREIFTQSPDMKRILSQADQIAVSESSVLILGETGVGKELLSRRIHTMSKRHADPFVVVDPTTIPDGLVESELFGHEKGAFTGAERRKKGLIELAHHGTLFIDEVGEIPKTTQVKLLRAIEEKTFNRVGGTQILSSDFRLITATNRDLAEEVAAGRFREDLYYRLNVVPLTLIPLRERKEDVVLLAEYFLDQYATKYNRPEIKITPEEERVLTNYHWPGNIRELINVMERAVLLSTGGQLSLNIPTAGNIKSSRTLIDDNPTLDELQRRYIKHILKKTGGKISGSGGAAEMLDIKRSTLYNRMRKLGI